MKRKTVLLVSLISVLLLAGLCACKQEVTPENQYPISEGTEAASLNAGITGVSIPKWDKSPNGLQNIPDVVTSGTGTALTSELKAGLYNAPVFKGAKKLIVIVCEGLTTELIESSASRYGELILNSLPVKGTTTSKFTSSDGKLLAEYIINDQYKNKTAIMAWGDTATNSLRRITTKDGNDVAGATVNYHQFMGGAGDSPLYPPLAMIMGKGDFAAAYSADYLNMIYKSSAVTTTTLAEAAALYKRDDIHFDGGGPQYQHDGPVQKLFTVFETDETLPSFRQEMAFSLAWMQSVMDSDGFCLFATYSPSSALNANGVQDFDEGVAVAVKFVLENPDTALLVCGCPVDGSEAQVCFYGLGKGVEAKSTLYECVTSLY